MCRITSSLQQLCAPLEVVLRPPRTMASTTRHLHHRGGQVHLARLAKSVHQLLLAAAVCLAHQRGRVASQHRSRGVVAPKVFDVVSHATLAWQIQFTVHVETLHNALSELSQHWNDRNGRMSGRPLSSSTLAVLLCACVCVRDVEASGFAEDSGSRFMIVIVCIIAITLFAGLGYACYVATRGPRLPVHPGQGPSATGIVPGMPAFGVMPEMPALAMPPAGVMLASSFAPPPASFGGAAPLAGASPLPMRSMGSGTSVLASGQGGQPLPFGQLHAVGGPRMQTHLQPEPMRMVHAGHNNPTGQVNMAALPQLQNVNLPIGMARGSFTTSMTMSPARQAHGPRSPQPALSRTGSSNSVAQTLPPPGSPRGSESPLVRRTSSRLLVQQTASARRLQLRSMGSSRIQSLSLSARPPSGGIEAMSARNSGTRHSVRVASGEGSGHIHAVATSNRDR